MLCCRARQGSSLSVRWRGVLSPKSLQWSRCLHGQITLVAAFLFAAVGCAGSLGGSSSLDQIGAYPDNYKQIFRSYIERAFYEPQSLRDVAISAPARGKLGSVPGWIVCLKTNAKDRPSGKYGGPATRAYLIRNGAITDVLINASICDNTPLEPWPEAGRRERSPTR